MKAMSASEDAARHNFGWEVIQDMESQNNAMFVVPQGLLDKIDQHRDKLSRAEFVDLCIDTLLELGEAQGNGAKDTISRTEFEDFKKSVKDILRVYIDLLPAATSEHLSKAAQGTGQNTSGGQ